MLDVTAFTATVSSSGRRSRFRAGIATLVLAAMSIWCGGPALAACTTSPPLDGLFLDVGALRPFNVKLVQDGGSRIFRDEKTGAAQGYFQMRTWEAGDAANAIGRVTDIRISFKSEAEAKEYVGGHEAFLSEGAPLDSEILIDGIMIRAFGPRNAKAMAYAESLELPKDAITAYSYVFVHQNVVAKVFVVNGMKASPIATARSLLPVARSALSRLKASCA